MKPDAIKKICVKCGAKCCFVGGPVVTAKEREAILKAGFPDVFVKAGRYYEVDSKTGRCPFLKNKLCLVHDVEPLMCKIWPIYPIFDGHKRRYLVLDCSLTKHLSKNYIQKLKVMSRKISKALSAIAIEDLSPAIRKMLNKFGWDEKVSAVKAQSKNRLSAL